MPVLVSFLLPLRSVREEEIVEAAVDGHPIDLGVCCSPLAGVLHVEVDWLLGVLNIVDSFLIFLVWFKVVGVLMVVCRNLLFVGVLGVEPNVISI